MMKKIIHIGLLLSCLALQAIEISVLQHLSPYELFGLIERVKIAAFSTDSFVHSGSDQQGVAQWNELTDLLSIIVLQEAVAESDTYYKLTKELEKVRNYIETSIDALHNGRAVHSAFAQKYWFNMHTLQERMFKEIKQVTKPGDDWIDAIPSSPILSVKHAALLKDFKYMAQQAAKDASPLRDTEIEGLLKLHGISSMRQINDLVNNLEQYCYRKQKDAKYARQFINELSQLYPAILSNYDMSILANTEDKLHTIIFAQAGAYENILHQLLREINGR
jgi:hypothetical protein